MTDAFRVIADIGTTALTYAQPIASLFAAGATGFISFQVGRAGRLAKSGELSLSSTTEVLEDASAHIARLLRVHKALMMVNPNSGRPQEYWDYVYDLIRDARVSLAEYRAIRDKLEARCGSEAQVTVAFSSLRKMNLKNEDDRMGAAHRIRSRSRSFWSGSTSRCSGGRPRSRSSRRSTRGCSPSGGRGDPIGDSFRAADGRSAGSRADTDRRCIS